MLPALYKTVVDYQFLVIDMKYANEVLNVDVDRNIKGLQILKYQH